MIKKTDLRRFHDKYERTDGCWLWKASTTGKGYGYFVICSEGKRRQINAHRFAYVIHNGLNPDDLAFSDKICHRCNTPACVNPEHLYLGTCQDNALDASRDGLLNPAKGESHGRSKLKEADVLTIRTLIERGHSLTKIATLYSVSPKTISQIKTRSRWKHLS